MSKKAKVWRINPTEINVRKDRRKKMRELYDICMSKEKKRESEEDMIQTSEGDLEINRGQTMNVSNGTGENTKEGKGGGRG